jgi:hypothetical protein
MRAGELSIAERNLIATAAGLALLMLVDEGEFAHDDEQALQEFSQAPRRRRIAPPRLPQSDRSGDPLTAELSEPEGDAPQILEFSLSGRTR